ncbi:competence type IV pilus minor pilin ComGG [Sutcliffiella rhizosphaerae]|nr:competence type IV pilus minor pilin ComGG [Sutcliffiella rhizosphaerae]
MCSLLSYMLLHQIENYRLEKMFYFEADQQFKLEAMMKYSWDVVQNELEKDGQIRADSIHFPYGSASINIKELGEELEITILCMTREERSYQAKVIYDIVNFEFLKWTENL